RPLRSAHARRGPHGVLVDHLAVPAAGRRLVVVAVRAAQSRACGALVTAAFSIRAARRDDATGFLALVRALAEFERLPGPTDQAPELRIEDAFGRTPRFELLVAGPAETPGPILAYAVFFATYSTFLARPSLYLEDIFVHPDARGRGLAEQMMRRLAA